MKVQEVMVQEVHSIRPDAPIIEAVEMLQQGSGGGEGGIRSLLVTEGEKITGIIVLRDILKAVIPPYLAQDPHLAHLAWNGLLEKQVDKIRDKTVSDFMTKDVVTVEEDAALSEAGDLLLINKIHSLPVTRKGKVVGMLYLSDLASRVFTFLSKGKM